MKLHDRVYDKPGVLGTVVATSADGADVFEGETVEVRWDATGKVETRLVETLDREAAREVAAIQADRAEIQRQLDDLDARMRPLQDERMALIQDLRAADELIAELAVTDAEIVATRNTRFGNARFGGLVRSLHPAIFGTCEWSPKGDYSEPDSELLPVPHLALKYGADNEYIDSLAAALLSYGERFLGALPAENDGRFDVELLAHDCGELHSWWITVIPATKTAILSDRHSRVFPHEYPEAALRDVIAAAVERAWESGGPASDEDRY